MALGDVGGGSGGGEMTMSEVSDFSREERTVSEVSDFSPSILPPQLTSSQSFMQPSTSSAPPYMCNPPPAYPQTTPPQLFCPPTPRPLRISTCTFLRLVFFIGVFLFAFFELFDIFYFIYIFLSFLIKFFCYFMFQQRAIRIVQYPNTITDYICGCV